MTVSLDSKEKMHGLSILTGCHRYLKHVVMKFICSREDEALQLVRAITVLLELTPQEEEHIKQYLDYKVGAI